MESTLNWDGSVLRMHSYAADADMQTTFDDTFSLSPDGKTLEMNRHIAGNPGSRE